MAQKGLPTAASLAEFVDGLQAEGRYTFTRSEAEQRTCLEGMGLEAALRRLRTSLRIASPRRGFHVIVPIEYRNAGAPPPSWFIGDFMRFLNQPYYVGLLTAAALHGAAHQQPMTFQVVTDRPTRKARAGRAQIAFHVARNLPRIPTASVPTETGSMLVSTPEATAFDLVRFASAAGNLSNVATVLRELAEQLSKTKLEDLAPEHSLPDVQRLGYLLDFVGAGGKAQGLAHWLRNRRVRPALLGGGRARGLAKPDGKWRILANVEVEPDR